MYLKIKKSDFFLGLIIALTMLCGCGTETKKKFKRDYYPSGEIKSYGFYIRDSMPVDTIFTFFKNGQMSSLEIYNGIGNAVKSVSYFDNGKLHKIINYENGLANGFFNTYDSGGKIINKIFYYNDKRIGDSYFYEKNNLTYNFYDWNGDNVSLVRYDSTYKIVEDRRQVIFIDSLKINNDSSSHKIHHLYDLLFIISNPPKCKTDVIIKFFSKKNNLIREDSVSNLSVFKKMGEFSDNLASIKIIGRQFDSLTAKTIYQYDTKILEYEVKYISLLTSALGHPKLSLECSNNKSTAVRSLQLRTYTTAVLMFVTQDKIVL